MEINLYKDDLMKAANTKAIHKSHQDSLQQTQQRKKRIKEKEKPQNKLI